jgi:hypothetical protein
MLPKFIVAVLAITALTACPTKTPTPPASDLKEVQDLGDMPESTDAGSDDEDQGKTCSQHLTDCKLKQQECQDTLNGCMTSIREWHLFEITKTLTEIPCGSAETQVKLLKQEDDTGWVYLEYRAQGNIRYSDKLETKTHKDRNVILVQETMDLIRVDSCSSERCKAACIWLP